MAWHNKGSAFVSLSSPVSGEPFFTRRLSNIAINMFCDCGFWATLLRRCKGEYCPKKVMVMVGRFEEQEKLIESD